MTLLLGIAFTAWCAVLWRLRGGAFTALTGIDPGTQPARIVCVLGIAAPLAWPHHDWWLMLLAPALWLGLVTAGWGPFQAMDSGKPQDKSSTIGWLLDHTPTGLRISRKPWRLHVTNGFRSGLTPWRCYIGMALAGVVCMAPSGAVIGWDFEPIRGVTVALGGAGFSPLYLAAYRLHLPYTRGGFIDWTTAWAELFVGALVGALLFVALIPALPSADPTDHSPIEIEQHLDGG
jgi:hypothetical protein